MMEALLQWDKALMHWINSGWSHPILDFIFPLIRNKYFWIPLYVLCIAWIIYNHQVRPVITILLFLGLSIFAADTISSQLIKYNVQRLRPCQEISMEQVVIERVACGSGYSFTSSHAANHFSVAAYFISIFWCFNGPMEIAMVVLGGSHIYRTGIRWSSLSTRYYWRGNIGYYCGNVYG